MAPPRRPNRIPNKPWRNLRQGMTAAHRRLRTDAVIFAVLLFALGATCGGGFAQGVVIGALLMLLPRLWTDIGAVLDLETIWDKYGTPPRKVGKHTGKAHSGHHPRPGARNQG